MKKIVSILISVGILAVIYTRIDIAGLGHALRDAHLGWLAAAVFMFGPTYLFITMRFMRLAPPEAELHVGVALKLVFAAATLNMVLPSKMGDVGKAYFMQDRSNITLAESLAIVLFEKAADMLALLLWGAVGLMVYRPDGWWGPLLTAMIVGMLVVGVALLVSSRFSAVGFRAVSAVLPGKLREKVGRLADAWTQTQLYAWRNRRMSATMIVLSILLWFLHLLQIWFFVRMLNADVPLVTHLAIMPLAILAGLLPLTFAGVGTRDAAIIGLYLPFFPAATGAALGLLCTSRYIVPAIIGLPFLGNMMVYRKARRQEDSAKGDHKESPANLQADGAIEEGLTR